MTQLNTPYPATAYLMGFLRAVQKEHGWEVVQADPALELFLRVFCREGMERVARVLEGRVSGEEGGAEAEAETDSETGTETDSEAETGTGTETGTDSEAETETETGTGTETGTDSETGTETEAGAETGTETGTGTGTETGGEVDGGEEVQWEEMPESVEFFLRERERYLETIDAVVRFLQGREPALAHRIASRRYLPEGPRFAALGAPEDGEGGEVGSLGWAFGALGLADRAKHLASLYIDDLADVVRDGIDPRFTLSRYGEKLAAAAPSFEPLRQALEGEATLVDEQLDELAGELVREHQPDLLGLTVPFPGNVYGALRLARAMRAHAPGLRVVLGGGYVNTELRQLAEPALFDYVDYVTLDDGERPLWALLRHLRDGEGPLLRTFYRSEGRVQWRSDPALHDVPLRDAGTPTYTGLPLSRYLSMLELLNPMHRFWSDGRWNKLTVAHGCYWKKCTFCDVTLDYISRYDPAGADLLVDRMAALIDETGHSGFHLVDEAAPPSGLRALAERLLARKLQVTWWGNIRFEKAFTPELVELLARSGCVAVSGGLEVASDRLLALINKGVTVAQVARVARAFAEAGVLVHAYLMYGFPTQTVQDTVDSLELVRQLFAEGCLHSAYWHRFAATVHSPVGQRPELFGIRLRPLPERSFARNDVAFDDPTGVDHDWLGEGLRRALYNYLHGLGLEEDVRGWFSAPRTGRRRASHAGVPRPTVAPDVIARALAGAP